jgi:Transposase IS116/IS110/IS902 family
VTRPTVRHVALKTPAQLDLQALHRVRQRLISQRTGVINQIRAFLLERGIAIRQGWHALRAELPRALTMTDRLTPRMLHIVEDLAGDWRRLDERIEAVSTEIAELAHADEGAVRLMSVPGIGPIISSATVAGIGKGDVLEKGRDFAAWLGLVPKQTSTGGRPILGRISKRGNANCLCKRLASCCSGRKPGSVTASSTGSTRRRNGSTTTSLPSRSPTSSPALPGLYCTLAAPSRRAGRTVMRPSLPDFADRARRRRDMAWKRRRKGNALPAGQSRPRSARGAHSHNQARRRNGHRDRTKQLDGKQTHMIRR